MLPHLKLIYAICRQLSYLCKLSLSLRNFFQSLDNSQSVSQGIHYLFVFVRGIFFLEAPLLAESSPAEVRASGDARGASEVGAVERTCTLEFAALNE